MMEGLNKCQHCVCMGKNCSGPNVSSTLLANLSEKENVARNIAEAVEALAETLNRLTRLRRHQQSLRERGGEVFRRGIERWKAEQEPDSPRPMWEEQSLVGQAQALGTFGVVDWEAMGRQNGRGTPPKFVVCGVVGLAA
ncbi:hypothetical protein P885DRAFT_43316 [Corynascus similis CBS 632.67]